jgi:hypothetical protein
MEHQRGLIMMMSFFKRLFAKKKLFSRSRAVRLMVEAFEPRDVPSAGSVFESMHHLAEQSHFRMTDSPTFARFSEGYSHERTTLSATLTGTAGASGTISFISNSESGHNSLNVQVSGLTANSSYTVESGSTTLGTISTDANGHGRLAVSDLSPALAAGGSITVVDSNNSTVLSGTLASASSSEDEGYSHECSSEGERTTLSATLTGTAGASGTVSFTSNSESGHNTLDVQVSGLSDNSTYTVESGTTTVGTITTNANGEGQLSVSDLSPALTSGATITVLDSNQSTVLSGTLQTASAPTVSRFTASLSGATGTSGTASLLTTSDGSRLRLHVSGLSDSTEYTVNLDGTAVGQIVTSASGDGSFTLSNLTTSAAAGSTITVTDASGTVVLQGTFSASTSFHHRWHHG